MTSLQRRRKAILLAGLVLLALFVIRPGANGLRKRIVNSVSLALGRRVDVQWVKLQALPQPGFDLVNFVVYDDPAFSAEPVLRAGEVTATLRLRSLLRGRLEIGRLSLKEPSFNLVRNENGHWNVESLIERAAHTEAAPTRNTRPEARPIFPYIEADNGRINFKVGLEKKSYSLTDADFALWLESDNQWGMRLTAQPVRTDFNLTDTGRLRVDGSWQRSQSLRDTPLNFSLRWTGAQLGQVTKLLYGRDMGWRGNLTLEAAFVGTPADLKVDARSSLDEFRRYDIVPQQSLRLATTCEARYSSTERALSGLVCSSPIGQGLLSVKGRIEAPTGPRNYDLRFQLENVPIQAVANLARRAKKDLPDDLSAAGTIAGTFTLKGSPNNGTVKWSGTGHTDHFALRSTTAKTELVLGTIPFGTESVAEVARKSHNVPKDIESNTRLVLGPFAMTLGKQSSVNVQGWASPSGYNFEIQGDGAVPRLLQAAQVAGLQVPQLTADGSAKVNLVIAGQWHGFVAPRPTGSAILHSVKAQIPGLNGAVDVRSANVTFDPDTVQVSNFTASAAGSTWEGALSFPRPCHLLSGCPVHFDLQADTVRADRLHQWLTDNRSHAWYRFAGFGSHTPSLLRVLNANGTLAASQFLIRNITANRVACTVDIHDGRLHLDQVTAEVLGGKHRGDWIGNLAVSPPEFEGKGKFEHVALAQLAETMHNNWIAGTANGSYQVSATGKTVQDWLSSGKGALTFDMRDGSLPHIVIASGAGPLCVHRFTGRLLLREAVFELANGRLDCGNATFDVSGTTLPGQKLQMKLTRSGGGFVIDGTLTAPHVVPVTAPDTRASLKP